MASSNEELEQTKTRSRKRRSEHRPVAASMTAVYPRELSWTRELDRAPVVVGRTADADAPLPHDTVSRRHCRIEWDAGAHCHVAVDLGSYNGIRVNGHEVEGNGRSRLGDGALLQLGDVLLVYERGTRRAERELPVSRDNIPGDSIAMCQLRAAVARAAQDPSPVLLIGDTGTGKEWIAREIHRCSGRPGPLIAINCSGFSPELIDSQLFGHVRGAFTGATSDSEGLFRAADGGTLFLDEIGDMPLSLQPKLLRVLQEGEVHPVGSSKVYSVDVRVISATNHDLAQQVEEGAFRRDLYARLGLWEVRVPPLSRRRADLLSWVDRLHRRWLADRDEPASSELRIAPDVAEAIILCPWPENLRGLDRLVHELATLPSPSDLITMADLPAWLGDRLEAREHIARPPDEPPPERPARPPVPTAEEFTAVFEQLDGNVRAMARHYGRDRRQIYRWIKAYDLTDRRGTDR